MSDVGWTLGNSGSETRQCIRRTCSGYDQGTIQASYLQTVDWQRHSSDKVHRVRIIQRSTCIHQEQGWHVVARYNADKSSSHCNLKRQKIQGRSDGSDEKELVHTTMQLQGCSRNLSNSEMGDSLPGGMTDAPLEASSKFHSVKPIIGSNTTTNSLDSHGLLTKGQS
ncbi:hypothetical protein EV363DRAFT_1326801 [Boletus edulis]|nr:hypothetical protein EV363DRAFT_1326801 [Boletus edulis]